MKTPYLKRSLESVLDRAAKDFPVVVLTGPRQSGKTTVLKHLFGRTHHYVSLELPDVRAAALTDPRGFLAVYPPPAIFDEIQYCPDLLMYVKEVVDAHRSRRGQYLLTGSQNLLLLERVTESLAGRAAILRLLPSFDGGEYPRVSKRYWQERRLRVCDSPGRQSASTFSSRYGDSFQ